MFLYLVVCMFIYLFIIFVSFSFLFSLKSKYEISTSMASFLGSKFVEFSRDLCHGSHEGRVVWEGSRDGSFTTGFLNS